MLASPTSTEGSGVPETAPPPGPPAHPPRSPYVDYVVVIHGMGAQRQNETLTSVISGFAAACSPSGEAGADFPVSLGSTRPSSGRWVERSGICAAGERKGPWEDRSSDSGESLRFMEICWSEVTTSALGGSAEAAPRWVRNVSQRIGRHDQNLEQAYVGADPPGPRVPFWLTHLIRLVRPVVHLGMPALSLLNQRLAHSVFSEHLGDVQVYCEDPDVRGRAIRRVHDALARLHDEHFRAERRDARPWQSIREPRITILAHSLGSALALDALAVAHLPADTRRDLQGYAPKGPPPEVAWLAFTHALFTIGSPAEKLLALWPANHAFHAEPKAIEAAQKARGDLGGRRILHGNFLEQMDVVGDPLVLYRKSPLYEVVFDCGAAPNCLEWAYVQDPRPLIAHVSYWTDIEVYRRIRSVAWAGEREVEARPRTSDERVWWWVHLYAPFLSALLLALTASATLRAASLGSALLYSSAFVAVLLLSVVSARLLTWWWALIQARSPRDRVTPGGRKVRPGGGARAPQDLGLFGPCVAAATAFSAAFGGLTGLAYGAPWIPPTLLIYGALCAGCWLLARSAGEGDGHPKRGVLAVLGTAGLTFVLLVSLRLRCYPTAPEAPAFLSEVSLITILITTALWITASLARLPADALHLRRGGVLAAARSWGLMLLLWGVVYAAPYLLLAFEATPGFAKEASMDRVESALRADPVRQACHGLFFGSTALMCLYTVMRHERSLARSVMDWRAWSATRWREYVTVLPRQAPAHAPPDAEGA